MNSSFLYHAFGLDGLICRSEQYKGKTLILNVAHRNREKECPVCGKHSLVKNGYRIRDFIGLPIGGKKTIIRMKVQRYNCKAYDYDRQEHIPFATGSCSYTHRLAKYVVELLKIGTLKDVSLLLSVSWDMIKEIHSTYPSMSLLTCIAQGGENIGIDEFAVRKGHVYKTIVVDLDTGRIIYVGNGKGADALAGFWKKSAQERDCHQEYSHRPFCGIHLLRNGKCTASDPCV